MERIIPLLLVALATSLAMCIAGQTNGNLITPALAQQDGGTVSLLVNMLNSSQSVARAKMVELQNIGRPVPSDVIEFYSLAITEKTLALDSLDQGDLESGKAHTLAAMRLFKQAADLSNDASGGDSLIGSGTGINEQLEELQNHKARLKTIIDANKLSSATGRDLSEFDAAFGRATLAVIQRNYDDAQEQVSRCEALLDSINEKIHSETEKSDQSERARMFADSVAERLEELINEAQEMGLSEEDMFELKSRWQEIADQLDNADDLESIIQFADLLIEQEAEVQVIIEELHDGQAPDDPLVDEPVDDEPVGDQPVDDSPPYEEPPTYDPSQFEEDYLQLQNDIAALKLEVGESGLTFPTSDTDEMLASFKQHAENGEDNLATQAMEELYDYLGVIHGVKDGYTDAATIIATATETAEGLRAQVEELNYLRFLPDIEYSQALLGDANSELANVADSNALSYNIIGSSQEHVDLASGSVAQVQAKLEATQASLDEFIAQVAETLEQIEQEEARADEIEAGIPNVASPLVNDILGTLKQARALLADARISLEAGELDQAQLQLSDASSLLDTAEGMLAELLSLPLL